MKRKMDREIRVKVQDDLYEQFSRKCEREFKTVSIVVRELMVRYVDEEEVESKRRIRQLEELKNRLIAQNPALYAELWEQREEEPTKGDSLFL